MKFYSYFSLILFCLPLACSYQSTDENRASGGPLEIISKPMVRFLNTVAQDPENWNAVSTIEIEVCFSRLVDRRPVEPNHPFRVRLIEAPGETGSSASEWRHLKSRADGCLNWTETVGFSFAAKRLEFLKRKLIVESESPEFHPSPQLSQAIYVDPWNQATLVQWDERANGFPQVTQPGPLQLRITHLAAAKLLRRDLAIDALLRLKFLYHYEFTFEPELNRPLALGSALSVKTVWPKSRYALRGALVSPEPDGHKGFNLVSQFTTELIAAENGQLKTSIVFPVDIDQEKFLDSRTRLVLDVVPLGKARELPVPLSIISSIDLRAEQSVLKTGLSQISAAELQKDRTLATEAFFPSLLSALGHEPSELKVMAVPAGEERLSELPVSTRSLSESLDHQIVNDDLLSQFSFLYSEQTFFPLGSKSRKDTDRNRFRTQPGDFVHWSFFDYAEKIDDVTDSIVSAKASYETLSVEARLQKEIIDSERKESGTYEVSSMESEGELRGRGFEGLGSGVRHYWDTHRRQETFEQVETVASDELRNEAGFSQVQNLYVDRLDVEFRVTQKRCLMMEFRKGRESKDKLPTHVFCKDGPTRASQSWFQITDEYRTNVFSFLDIKNLNERQIRTLFRGEQSFRELKRQLSDRTRSFEIRKRPDGESNLKENLTSQISSALKAGGLPPGILRLERGPDSISRFETRCRALSNQLVIARENTSPSAEKIAVFFNLALRHPKEVMGSPAARERFSNLGKLLASNPRAREAYLNLMDLLYSWIDERHFDERRWLTEQAAALGDK